MLKWIFIRQTTDSFQLYQRGGTVAGLFAHGHERLGYKKGYFFVLCLKEDSLPWNQSILNYYLILGQILEFKTSWNLRCPLSSEFLNIQSVHN